MAEIRIERVAKSFGAVTVLNDISLSVADGNFVALLGPSGCGKTTLLRIIAGLETQTDGRVLIDERDVSGLPPRARGLAMVFQNYAVFPHMTVRQNVGFGLAMARVDTERVARQTERAARLMHIESLLDRHPAHLSGGQRQRVAVARALAVEPAVLLMDEPLSNLDPPHQADWLALARSLADAGSTVVSVLHEISPALQADEMVVLAAGRIVHQGACGDAATHEALAQVFDRRLRVRELDGQWVALTTQ